VSGNVCAFDDFAQFAVVGVAVPHAVQLEIVGCVADQIVEEAGSNAEFQSVNGDRWNVAGGGTDFNGFPVVARSAPACVAERIEV
jgi:hypothetical protein